MQQDEDGGVTIPDDGQIGPPGVWPTFRHPQLNLFLKHWAERRPLADGKPGLMAPRSALDPAVLKSYLPDVWLFRYDMEQDRFICSLAGERVNEAWGVSLIGKSPQQFMPADAAALAHAIYRRIILTPALHVSHRRTAPHGAREKAAERLVVPLSRDDGQPYGIFGLSLYYYDPVSEAGHIPYVGHNVTYYACDGLPSALPSQD